jgi:hypothetical protein
MRIKSSGNKLTNFFSKNCTYRNLWITGQRNSLVNFEIDVKENITKVHGGEAVLIANQSNMLANGTIGAVAAVPAGETAIRIKNGTRQTIRDVDFVGTTGSSAPLISVECNSFAPLNDSMIVAKCTGAGTFVDLHPVYASGTASGGSSTQIQLAASHRFADNELNGMIVTITGGTGSGQSRTITDYTQSTNTADVSPPWTTNPTANSTYEVKSVIGTGNYVWLTTSPGSVTKPVNLPSNWNDLANEIWVDGVMQASPAVELTIANGVITLTQRTHVIDTEADAASDDLATINGGVSGRMIVLRAADTNRTVVLKDGVGNLKLEGDFSLDNTEDTITLFYDGTNWLEKARRNNGP